MVIAPKIQNDWMNRFKRELSTRGFAVVAPDTKPGVMYTAGLSLNQCRPELLFEDVESDVADFILETVQGNTGLGIKYSPGIYEILGREIRFSEIPGPYLSELLPVTVQMVNPGLRALRICPAPRCAARTN